MVDYYDMIFKRKSFHLFRNVGDEKITPAELTEIEKAYRDFAPLYPEIRTAIRIVPAQTVNFKRDAEYCILIYWNIMMEPLGKVIGIGIVHFFLQASAPLLFMTVYTLLFRCVEKRTKKCGK